MLMAVPNQISPSQLHTSLILHKQLQTNINLSLMHTGQLQMPASLHSRYQNADQQNSAELKQQGVLFPREMSSRCSMDLCLADAQAYIQPWKLSEKA